MAKSRLFQNNLSGQRHGPWLLRVLVVIGFAALVYYYGWWAGSGRITSPLLLVALSLAMLYCSLQIAGSWVLYLAARRTTAPLPYPQELTVDVYVTAYNEPYALVARALAAAVELRGAHRTWLLDDGSDPSLAQLAAALGAGYLTRSDRTQAKAGNINAALVRTHGDILVIFDVDHAPTPDFLERTLGYFTNPRMGFVQVMPTFYNSEESWIARAAAESSLDFYNPISLGMHRMGSATMMGSNALIRRQALTSIGGYQPGLAEDLATSITLHAAGWQSAYVAEPLAPGLAPPDLHAWFTQQLKWARGVFEVVFTLFPRVFPRLNWGQRLSYGVRMTYYWIGPVIAVHMVAALAITWIGDRSAQREFESYLLSLIPLILLFLSIRQIALQSWRHPSIVASLLWRAVVLIYSTWPIYTLAWFMALLRVPLHFRLTPKRKWSGGIELRWLLPQVASVLAFALSIPYAGLMGGSLAPPILVAFALGQIVPQVFFITQCFRSTPRMEPLPGGGLLGVPLSGSTLLPFKAYPVGEPSVRDES